MRTGMRCTMRVKFPVAGSNGSSENSEPDPGAKLSTSPSKVWPGTASNGDAHALTGKHARRLRFLEIGDDIDRVHRNDRHQLRAGLHVFADLCLAIAYDAGDGRTNDRVFEILRASERAACAFGERWRAIARAFLRSTSTCWLAGKIGSAALLGIRLRRGGGRAGLIGLTFGNVAG